MRQACGRTIMAAVMVMGLAAVVAAQPPAGGGMPGQGRPGMRQGMMGPGAGGGPMAALNLTAEQRERIQKIQENHRAATQKTAETLRGLHEQFRNALFGENPDDAKALAGQIADLEAQLAPSRLEMQIAVVKELTADQKKIAKELNLFGGMMGGPGMRGRMPAAR